MNSYYFTIFTVLIVCHHPATDASFLDKLEIFNSNLFSSKVLECYTCKNTTTDACNHPTKSSEDIIKKCEVGAKGCVTQIFPHKRGNIMIKKRGCYYEPIGMFVNKLNCEGREWNVETQRGRVPRCYKCRNSLCNDKDDSIGLSMLLLVVFGILTVVLIFAIGLCCVRRRCCCPRKEYPEEEYYDEEYCHEEYYEEDDEIDDEEIDDEEIEDEHDEVPMPPLANANGVAIEMPPPKIPK